MIDFITFLMPMKRRSKRRYKIPKSIGSTPNGTASAFPVKELINKFTVM
jgi:hypothetical protein